VNATRIRTFANKLGKSFDLGTKPASDAELLTRFLDNHDEIAFEELIARHLSAVRAVCRSVLRDPNDADDAAQATFLVFVRRANAVRNKLALGAWLCRIAWRTANRLREANARRAARHLPGIDPDTTAGREASLDSAEVATAIEDEIRRLPELYRMAVLTCYAAGVSTTDAAMRLGWPKGTLLTRLAWARKRLRSRLLQRGVTVSGSISAVLAIHSSCAADAIVVCRYAAAGMAVALGDPVAKELISERVSTLMEGTVRAMIATKMKLVLGIGLLVVALLGIGIGRMTLGSADAAQGDKKTSPVPTAPVRALTGANAGKDTPAQNAVAESKAEDLPAGPGNDLIVRRPLGSYTRDIPAIGKATATFTENRIHVLATVRIEKATFTVTADADYAMNRESMVYGIITAVELEGGGLKEEETAIIGQYVSFVHDTPFSFRLRVDDDAIVIKDIKWGALGSLLFSQVLEGSEGKELLRSSSVLAGMVSGKYKADAIPDLNVPVKPKKK
jgi:RNA polymerase sigma factor (sigma-70 family)